MMQNDEKIAEIKNKFKGILQKAKTQGDMLPDFMALKKELEDWLASIEKLNTPDQKCIPILSFQNEVIEIYKCMKKINSNSENVLSQAILEKLEGPYNDVSSFIVNEKKVRTQFFQDNFLKSQIDDLIKTELERLEGGTEQPKNGGSAFKNFIRNPLAFFTFAAAATVDASLATKNEKERVNHYNKKIESLEAKIQASVREVDKPIHVAYAECLAEVEKIIFTIQCDKRHEKQAHAQAFYTKLLDQISLLSKSLIETLYAQRLFAGTGSDQAIDYQDFRKKLLQPPSTTPKSGFWSSVNFFSFEKREPGVRQQLIEILNSDDKTYLEKYKAIDAIIETHKPSFLEGIFRKNKLQRCLALREEALVGIAGDEFFKGRLRQEKFKETLQAIAESSPKGGGYAEALHKSINKVQTELYAQQTGQQNGSVLNSPPEASPDVVRQNSNQANSEQSQNQTLSKSDIVVSTENRAMATSFYEYYVNNNASPGSNFSPAIGNN